MRWGRWRVPKQRGFEMSDICPELAQPRFLGTSPRSRAWRPGRRGASSPPSGFLAGVSAVQVGIRELQRETSRVIGRVADGEAAIVTRDGRPVAVLVPAGLAPAWVQLNRPLDPLDPSEDEASWRLEDGVRVAPSAEAGLELVQGSVRGRLLRELRRLCGPRAVGRVALKVGLGQLWALAELTDAEPPTLLSIDRRRDLEISRISRTSDL